MAATRVWNIYLPVDILAHSSAYLTGYINHPEFSFYVTGISSVYVHRKSEHIIGLLTCSKKTDLKLIAISSQTVHLSILRSPVNLLECRIYRHGEVAPCKCVCVLFDPKDLLSSFILAEDYERCTGVGPQPQLGYLFKAYKKNRWSANFAENNNRNHSRKDCILKQTFSWCLSMMILVFSAADWLLSGISLKWFWSRICVQSPAVISHVTNKLDRFKRLQSLQFRPHESKLVLLDVCGQQLLDTVLGMILMLYMIDRGCADGIATSVMCWADDTASYLKNLLHWLMGAPAGLKLNAQLTQYMGHFFLYHVYLWSGYLRILRPALGWIIRIAAGSGILGFSTHLCLVQDIISMLTLHIYCFYVYAARLYSLQMYALTSLWRLFRGKKWNVLRLRVDSAQYNVDQLCIGTLLFTVLLFLLPTTLLYYFVFTSLRLLVLSVHGLLAVVIDSINTVPAITLILRVLKSKSVGSDIFFTVIQGAEHTNLGRCVVLSLQVTHLPIQKLYCRAQFHLKVEEQREKKYSWIELLQRLAFGNLIYPWVNTCSIENNKQKLS